jgi:hypothetical protein
VLVDEINLGAQANFEADLVGSGVKADKEVPDVDQSFGRKLAAECDIARW